MSQTQIVVTKYSPSFYDQEYNEKSVRSKSGSWYSKLWSRFIAQLTGRNFFIYFFNFFVVIAKCFLCFIGMLVFSSALWLGILAVWLMAGIQWEVNKSGFSQAYDAFQNIFNPQRRLLEKYINAELNALASNSDSEISVDENSLVVKYLAYLRNNPKSSVSAQFFNLKNDEAKIEFLRYNLVEDLFKKENFYLKLNGVSIDDRDFLENLNSAKHKRWILFSFFLLLSLVGGVSVGLAALSSINIAIHQLGWIFLLATPQGVFIAIAAAAVIGFTFLLYQTISKVYEKLEERGVKKGLKSYFWIQKNESSMHYFCRALGMIIAFGLAVFAIWGTFGTFWTASKNGALTFEFISNYAAAGLRTVTVLVMILPTFVFALTNSLEALNKIFGIEVGELFSSFGGQIAALWKEENGLVFTEHPFRWFLGFLRFINPFRAVSALLRKITVLLIFVGHVTTEGLIGDHPEEFSAGIPDEGYLITGSVSDALVDCSYLEVGKQKEAFRFTHINNQHHHYSWLIKCPLFLIGCIVFLPLDLIAVIWDWVCGAISKMSFLNLKDSWLKISPFGNIKMIVSDKHDHEHVHEHEHDNVVSLSIGETSSTQISSAGAESGISQTYANDNHSRESSFNSNLSLSETSQNECPASTSHKDHQYDSNKEPSLGSKRHFCLTVFVEMEKLLSQNSNAISAAAVTTATEAICVTAKA